MAFERKDTSACQSTTSDCELLQLDKATSAVWHYFGFPAREGKFIEPDKKKEIGCAVNFVHGTFHMLKILLTCGST